ncbi:MAG: methylenetetrahydrofolate reductase [NAD(P)H], partial [Chlorobiaceae bacterium]|nr:methylenetetrahydrofolate reductase [NAD(P)H] [Chlorobiaceae bacterium]
MLVKEILSSASKPVFSFEFFPPKKDEEWDTLFDTIAALSPLNPSYVSVTYGAGGSTRSRTHDLVTRIQKETGLTVVSHLTCICSKIEET